MTVSSPARPNRAFECHDAVTPDTERKGLPVPPSTRPAAAVARWPLIMAAVALLLYLALLLVSNYTAVSRLQDALAEQSRSEVREGAHAVQAFLDERLLEVDRLATGREMTTYLANRALGMSLRYGLGQSLDAVLLRMQERVAEQRAGYGAVFSRFLLLDAAGEQVLDTQPEAPAVRTDWLARANDTPHFHSVRGQALIVYPLVFEDRPAGVLLAVLSLERVLSSTLAPAGTANARGLLLYVAGQWQVLGNRSPLLAEQAVAMLPPPDMTLPSGEVRERQTPSGDRLVTVTLDPPVLHYIRLMPTAGQAGVTRPELLALGLAVLALVLTAFLVLVYRSNVRASEFAVRVEEAVQRERDIQQANLVLEGEIASRRAAEVELRHRERHLRAVADYTYDWESWIGPDGELLWVNPAVERFTGIPVERCLAMSDFPLPLIHMQDRFKVRQVLHASRERAEREMELRILKRDAQHRPQEVWAAMVWQPIQDVDGTDLGVRFSIRDITERREAMEAMRWARDAAEATSRAKSRFVANVSHEIRTPMNGVVGMAAMLAETALTAPQRDCVETIQRSADALLDIINDILDFSKIEADRLELEQRPFELQRLVEDATDLILPKATDKGLQVHAYVAAELPRWLLGDAGRLRQVLLNLLGNAAKFTASGQILLTAERDATAAEGERLLLRVEDTGSGIPEADQQRLFDAFVQVEDSKTRSHEGTGLGLAISRRLVQAMQGDIHLHSELGRGSTFTVALPLQPAPAPPPTPDPVAVAVDLTGQSVLVKVDHPLLRRLLLDYLRDFGAEVQELAAVPPEPLEPVLSASATGTVAAVVVEHGAAAAEELLAWARETGRRAVRILEHGLAVDEGVAASDLVRLPVKKHLLGRALFGQPDTTAETAALAASTTEDRMQSAKLLLVEDNPTNRKVATMMLQRLGHQVDVAEHGAAALTAMQTTRYDLVFMDVSMPVMNGLEAATRWREHEAGGTAHLPIVAMTAHASDKDRDECLAAGMDDFISKPVRMDKIGEVIARQLPPAAVDGDAGAAAGAAAPAAAPAGPPVLDADGLLQELDGDQVIAAEILQIFLDDLAERRDALQAAMQAADCRTIGEVAHALKGAAGNVFAQALEAQAAQLQADADGARAAACQDAWAQIDAVIARTREAVQAFLER